MKTLENHTLLYDQDCPLCNAYTSGFIRANMLDTNGRKPFHFLDKSEHNFIDVNRATNEIALIDTENKTVIYGIDSLLKVIGNSFPIIEKIGNLKPIHFLLQKLYSFISYNRKVIIPSKRKREIQCIPNFNFRYRFLYIIIVTLITTLVLFKFSNSITIIPTSSIQREFIVAFGQIIFQYLFLNKIETEKTINYIGNLMTVSLIGSILIILLIMLNSIVNMPQNGLLFGFGLTVLIMFLEHSKRVKILELPRYLSYSWVLYRIIVLFIILSI